MLTATAFIVADAFLSVTLVRVWALTKSPSATNTPPAAEAAMQAGRQASRQAGRSTQAGGRAGLFYTGRFQQAQVCKLKSAKRAAQQC
jgi:hypothetical protein